MTPIDCFQTVARITARKRRQVVQVTSFSPVVAALRCSFFLIRTIALLITLGFPWLMAAAAEVIEADHVRISWLAPEEFAADPAAQNATLGIYFEPDPEWHVYWRNPGDSGAAPRFMFTPMNLALGPVLWPFPARLPVAHLMNLGYEGSVAYLFNAGVEPLDVREQSVDAQLARLEVELEWLVCKEECIPGFGKLTLERPIRGDNHRWQPEQKGVIDRFLSRVPQPETQSPWQISCAYWGDNGILTLKLQPRQGQSLAELPPPEVFSLDGNFIKPAAPEVKIGEDAIELRFSTMPGVTPPSKVDFVVVADERAWEFSEVTIHRGAYADEASYRLWLLVLSAILGGVILNLMPCVFPVLSIKLFGLVNAAPPTHALTLRRLREGWLYTAGVLTTFIALGVIFLVLRAGGAAIGWGFQLQSPTVVLALILLFWVMALSFLGYFVVGHRLMQMAGNSHSGGSSFMTGVLAVFVAAPCTGPFMGAALGAAATLPAAWAMAIFIGLGVGLAAPFLLLAASPRLVALLPKPGPWMESLRQFLAFPLFATVLWLLWVLGKLIGDAGWVIAGSLLLWSSFALWLFRSPRLVLRLLAWAILLLVVAWAFHQVRSQGAPIHHADFQSSWVAYDNERITQARAEGQGVFIDFTAAWCITCQVNKKIVLDTAAVDQLFRDNQVLRVRADWTRYDPEITAALAAFGRNSVPVYVYYPPDGGQPKILPQVLTVEMIRELFP